MKIRLLSGRYSATNRLLCFHLKKFCKQSKQNGINVIRIVHVEAWWFDERCVGVCQAHILRKTISEPRRWRFSVCATNANGFWAGLIPLEAQKSFYWGYELDACSHIARNHCRFANAYFFLGRQPIQNFTDGPAFIEFEVGGEDFSKDETFWKTEIGGRVVLRKFRFVFRIFPHRNILEVRIRNHPLSTIPSYPLRIQTKLTGCKDCKRSLKFEFKR